jgi:cell division protein FtsL
MNAATRVYAQGNVFERHETVVFHLPDLRVLILIFLLLMSALGIVYIKDLNRRTYIEFQQMQAQNEQLQADKSKLLLEQSAWSSQARLQQVAAQQLAMHIPPSAEIVMLKV